MTRKAWVVTSQSFDENGVLSAAQLVEHISARKKIGFIDDYLCDLYDDMLDDHQAALAEDAEKIIYDDALIRSKINHPSGLEVVLEHVPFRLHAALQDIEEE